MPHSFELAMYVFLETYSYELAAKWNVILSSQLNPESCINDFFKEKNKLHNLLFNIDGRSRDRLFF